MLAYGPGNVGSARPAISPAATSREGPPMNTEHLRDVHFEAMKDVTRLFWLLNFEAVATVPGTEGAVRPELS
jgi:hypothetical protein